MLLSAVDEASNATVILFVSTKVNIYARMVACINRPDIIKKSYNTQLLLRENQYIYQLKTKL